MKKRWNVFKLQHSLIFDEETWLELCLQQTEGEQHERPPPAPVLRLVVQNDSESVV